MNKVRTEPDQLDAAGAMVAAAGEALGGTAGGLTLDAAGRDLRGSITAALLPTFAAEWRQHAQQLAEGVRTTGEHIQDAAAVYSALDRNAAEMFADLRAAVLGGGR